MTSIFNNSYNNNGSNMNLAPLDFTEIPYNFPIDKLDLSSLKESPLNEHTGEAMQPVVLIACGSFSPITHLHLRMFGT